MTGILLLAVLCTACVKESEKPSDPTPTPQEVKQVVKTELLVRNGAYLTEAPNLSGRFETKSTKTDGYQAGFEISGGNSAKALLFPDTKSSTEDFIDGTGGSLIADEGKMEWTALEGNVTINPDFSFSLTPTSGSLQEGGSYWIRAWARVGAEGTKVYSDSTVFSIIEAIRDSVSCDFTNFFLKWQKRSTDASDKWNYHWYDKTSAYQYGDSPLLFERKSKGTSFSAQDYFLFRDDQSFSFTAGTSGRLSVEMLCKAEYGSSSNNLLIVSSAIEKARAQAPANDYSTVGLNAQVSKNEVLSIRCDSDIRIRGIRLCISPDSAVFSCKTDKTEGCNRDTLYNVTIEATRDLHWTANVSKGCTVSISGAADESSVSGSGPATLKVRVPLNWDKKNPTQHSISITTSDSRIAVPERNINLTVTQGPVSKVLFGYRWDSSVFKAWQSAGFQASQAFTYDHLTLSAEQEEFASGDIKGNYSVSFKAGESGTGTLSFKARIYATSNEKTLSVKVNGKVFWKKTVTSAILETFTVGNIPVSEGDTVLIESMGSGNHKFFLTDESPLIWERYSNK